MHVCVDLVSNLDQVILYKPSNDASVPKENGVPRDEVTKWVYVGYVRPHTHDIRALTMASPISREGLPV